MATAFFPVFLSDYWAANTNVNTTILLGNTNALAALIAAILCPIIGATADRAGLARFWLLLFSLISIACCMSMAFIGKGEYTQALWVFGIASVGAAAANAIYDGLLTEATEPESYHRVSLFGYSFGYLAGGLVLTFNVLCIFFPEKFGLAGKSEAVKLAFVSAGLWWLVFMLPLFKHTKKRSEISTTGISKAIFQGCASLWNTAKHIRSQKPVLLFLIAYWFYIDGVGTIYKMAVDFGKALEFDSGKLIAAILVVQFVSFPAALTFTHIAKHIGAKKGIYIGIIVYSIVCALAGFMQNIYHFYALAVLVGLAQGGLQSLSRSYFALLIPKEKSGEYFGFYNAFGRFAAIIGPALMAWVTHVTGNIRLSMVSILLLFILGAIFLSFVKNPNPSH